jgi:hypothetical protein
LALGVQGENHQGTKESLCKRLLDDAKEGLYIQFILKDDNNIGRSNMWKALQMMLAHTDRTAIGEFTSKLQFRTLVMICLLPGVHCSTRFHVDWAEGFNLAFGIKKSKGSVMKGPVAYWIFVHPVAISDVDAWLIQEGLCAKQGLQCPPKDFNLTLDQWRKMKVTLGFVDIQKFIPKVMIVSQESGEVVRVPPGWLHAVINVQCNFKVAFDHFRVSNLVKYITLWETISTTWTTACSNVQDYMGVVQALVDEANR